MAFLPLSLSRLLMPQSEAPSMNELGSRGLRYALTMVPPPTTVSPS